MTPACFDNPTIPCRWDDDTLTCPCLEPYEPEPVRAIEDVPTGDLL